jgi:hypothetical protein
MADKVFDLATASDDEIAKAALIEVAAMALGPASEKTKIAALNTVLAYTKQKPATKVDAKINSLEAWLADVNGDGAE